jgi:diaminopimelate decarboxylase
VVTSKIIETRQEGIYIDGVSASELAEKFDTPLYVVSENRIRENYRRLHRTLTRNYVDSRIYYSAKANSNISVLKILESEGSYLDAVSPGEVFLALKAGFTPERILFTGTSVRDDELKFLVDSNVTINIDSLSELRRLLKLKTPTQLSVRVNPEFGAGHHNHCITAGKNSKFGIWEEDVVTAYREAKEGGVEKFGIHMHIGSGILKADPFIRASRKLLKIAGKIHSQLDIEFEFIDIGGGLGVPYTPSEKELDLKAFSQKVSTLLKEKIKQYRLGHPTLFIEPGRYIVCDAATILTRVNTVKVTPFKRFIGIDAGFNILLRPTMYNSYHQIQLASKKSSMGETAYDVAGPLCESGDLIARDRKLPKIEEGDLLAIMNAGAYGYAMSSQYNSRPRPAEILVKDWKYTLIRKAETVQGLTAGQKLAEWLK